MNQTDRFCAEDNKKLIEHLKNKGIIKSPLVFEAMCLVDRKKFVNKFNPYNNAYIDAPQNIGHGRTISAPHMHGMIFEILAEKLTTAKNVLCIRCSTGYVSNCMSIMMGPYGTVIHIESIPELKEKIKQTIENAHPYLLWGNRIKLLDVENESAGYPQHKVRYDVIYVGAAAAEIPEALMDQLAYGGRLVIPIGPKDLQQLMQIDKDLDGTIVKKSVASVRYGYLDSPREITNAKNNTEIKAENRSYGKSVLNLNSKNFNNIIIRENIQTQSPTKIQISSPTKPAQDHFNGCVKVNQTITKKLDTKIDEKNAQLNVKKNDDLQNFEKIREKSIFDTSQDNCLLTSSHKAKETGSSMKMQTASLRIPMQNDSNSCIKDEVTLQVTKEKLQIESGHSTEQPNSKALKENLQKSCQELVSLEKKMESRKDNLQNVQKIEDIKNVSNLELNSELETASDNIELETTMDELMATHAVKTTVENIEQPHQKTKFDKSVEKLKTNLKVENLQNLYVDDIMKKLTLLLDTKLVTKIDENLNVKIGSIERRIILLEDEIKKFNDIIKQEANEQKIFLCEMDKALKIKIEKLRNKIGSVEKDNKITERKLSNKIVRVKECMDEKIIDEVEELSKRLKMIEETNELFEKEIKNLSIAFEERLLKEKADIYMQIDAELEKKEQRQLDSVKSNISCLEKDIEMLKKKLTNKKTNNKEQWCYCFMAFPMIITLHATYALFKNLS